MRLAYNPKATLATINIICKTTTYASGLQHAHGNFTNIDLVYNTTHASGLHTQNNPSTNLTDRTLVHKVKLYHKVKETTFKAS
jgi:hypothetical protein